jgi:acyl dehydratase
MFGGTIVHGILVSSLFSNLFGRSLPGSIYVSQTLQFRRPVHVGKRVTARVEVKEVKPHRTKGHILVCDTTVRIVADTADSEKREQLCINGEGHVLVPKQES